MKILAMDEKENELTITYETHDVALFELVVSRLNQEKGVEATYIKEHPLVPKVVLTIRGKDPKKSLEKVIKKLEKEFK
ncbi:MAG: hypothetical protein GXN92_01250 [Candidatus Micrarchaeota archaeon]|nr:hypothetical protein [Candidatus Micrarchaeota archaeon]